MAIAWEDGRGTLKFVLDPAAMKARKRLDAPPPSADGAPASADEA
jgi:hypothetical protein